MSIYAKVLLPSLNLLRDLYRETNTPQDTLSRVIVMPTADYIYNVVLGKKYGAKSMEIGFGSADYDFVKTLMNAPLLEVASALLPSGNFQERSMGIAALSAASKPFTTSEALGHRGIVEGLSYRKLIKREDIVTVVGLGIDYEYLSFLESLSLLKKLYVTDMRGKKSLLPFVIQDDSMFFYAHGELRPSSDNEFCIGQSNVVAITASSLVNDTFMDLLSYVKNAREIALYGFTGDFIPDILFSMGITSVEPIDISYDCLNQLECNNDAHLSGIKPALVSKVYRLAH